MITGTVSIAVGATVGAFAFAGASPQGSWDVYVSAGGSGAVKVASDSAGTVAVFAIASSAALPLVPIRVRDEDVWIKNTDATAHTLSYMLIEQ
jgi:hypothetical protein